MTGSVSSSSRSTSSICFSEADLRRSIRAETTKVESYNDFLDWVGFGGPVLKSDDPEEQAKQVKHMDLVANFDQRVSW
ncbi:Tn3 family transposase [Lamprobacter modestohalophilus]|uniref:Tn3 family transposase n=1 Tax=Lamprobacter modestohalophilus TaxID=1064514 RepID=UPI002ADEFA5E|nr:Tn3 family transposase [Lamprobacter modestohalophilus]MEA1052317.1 Tn3 family transposase [Lamprobacter modestohalophilus]